MTTVTVTIVTVTSTHCCVKMLVIDPLEALFMVCPPPPPPSVTFLMDTTSMHRFRLAMFYLKVGHMTSNTACISV